MRALVAAMTLIAIVASPPETPAQSANRVSEREKTAAKRYLQVLLRRPRPGVALDRVYGFHVQNDSLADLRRQLLAQADSEDSEGAGARRMIWGLIELQRGRAAEAATILAEAEKMLPQDAACSFQLGRALLAIGQTEKAAAAMERAIDREPARTEALEMFTELGRIYSRAGQLKKSMAVWQRLEEQFPGDTRVAGQIARTLAEEGNYEEAKRRYDALAESARSPEERLRFAIEAAEMQRALGEQDQAVESLEKILARLRPGSWLHSDVRNRIEAGFLKSGDYDALADYYSKKLDKRPDDLALRTRLATVMISADRLNEARSLLESAIERAPDNAETRLALINVLTKQNQIAAAAEQYRQLCDRDPENPDLLIQWGQLLLQDTDKSVGERREEAAEVWMRLANAREDDAVTLSQVADQLRGINRSEQAIKLYRKAIEVDPTSPQYREYLGEYLFKLDRKDEAIKVWQSLAADDRRNRDSLVRLAEVFGTFEMPERALETWKQAAEFDLTFGQQLRYATKLLEGEQYDQAIQRLELAAPLAETPEEKEQLLQQRIAAFQASGTLDEQIAKLSEAPPTADNLRKLAMLHAASNDLVSAEQRINQAIKLAPEDSRVVLVAADLAERQNRIADAAELYESLAGIDQRFRSNYLKRVASLQTRLGQIDQAMETCQAVINANPASPESYQFLARQAFRVGRGDEGVAALRRAMTVAPRDNASRRMLAGHFASRFQTDEAIELYWQAFRYESQADDKIAVIRSLAPLYDRKTELKSLINRIRELTRNEDDARTTQLMIAAAYESVQDYGAARNAIEPLIERRPKDVGLLEMLVRLSDAAGDVLRAAEYQERVTELADTPQNRFKLIQLKLDAGTMDIRDALAKRVSFVSDPSRLMQMIDSAIRRSDYETAKTICREAIEADPGLWDVKLTYAQLLFLSQGTEDVEASRKEALGLLGEIRSRELAYDTKPPTATRGSNLASRTNSSSPADPSSWRSPVYELARQLSIGQYASYSYSSSSRSYSTYDALSFGHARIIAATLDLLAEAIGKSPRDGLKAVNEKFEKKYSVPPAEQIDDAMVIWEHRALESVSRVFPNQQVQSDRRAADQKRTLDLLWRLSELDPEHGFRPLLAALLARARTATANSGRLLIGVEPLSEDRLETLVKLTERYDEEGYPGNFITGRDQSERQRSMRAIVRHELRIAGNNELAKQFTPEPPTGDANYDELVRAIEFYLQVGDQDVADSLVSKLLPAARRQPPPSGGSTPFTSGIASGIARMPDAFLQRHRKALLDAGIADWARSRSVVRPGSVTLGDGTVRTYLRRGNVYRSMQVRGPLSPTLLDSGLAQLLLAFAPNEGVNASVRSNEFAEFELPAELIGHLESPLAGALPEEQKTRYVAAGFAHWWAERPERCYQLLEKLCNEYGDQVDLQIERARLASELGQPEVALQALDSFDPLDSRTLVRKEMAAMNLAAELGNTERAKRAAERLFGMRLDVKTQLALVDQLKRLGMTDKASAMLQRTRSSRVRDVSTELEIANAFSKDGDQEAAAEVAYGVLRRLSSGRSRQSNADYYRRRAVTILKNAGRFAPLIERAERRLEMAPKSFRARQELAELYAAAGQASKANELWADASESGQADPQALINRAQALSRAGKREEAIQLYLDAFEKEPRRIESQLNSLVNVARSAGDDAAEQVFKRLTELPLDGIPYHRLDDVFRLGPRQGMSEAKKKFIGKVLTMPSMQSQLQYLIRSLSSEQRKQIPEYRDALLTAVCSDDAFSPTSQTWAVRSRSSSGTASGMLADIVALLQSDEEADAAFRQAVSRARQDVNQALSAQFLVAVVDVNEKERFAESVTSVQELVEISAEQQEIENRFPCDGLLWQGGQILQQNDQFPSDTLLSVFRLAEQKESSSSSGPQYTVSHRMVDLLIELDRSGEARDLLWNLFLTRDYAEQNQYNPGYGDYQLVRAHQWIAETLVEADAPLEAAWIYQTLLSDEGRFERMRRYSGSRDYKQDIQKNLSESLQSVSPAEAAAFLKRRIEESEESGTTSIIPKDWNSPRKLIGQEHPSMLVFAVKKAAEESSGRESLQKLSERLSRLAEADEESWNFAAIDLLVACVLGTEMESKTDRLFERLPTVDEINNLDDEVTAQLTSASLFELFPITKSIAEIDTELTKAVADRLVKYLNRVGETIGDSAMILALGSIPGNGTVSIEKVLETVKRRIEPGTTLSNEMVEQLLGLAADAAQAGDFEVTAEALTLSLGSGPPLRKISTGSNPFAVNPPRTSSSSRQQNPQAKQMEAVTKKLAKVHEAISEATNISLGHLDGYAHAKPKDVDPARLEKLVDAYLAIVLPASRPGLVYSYSVPLLSDSSQNNQPVKIRSASMALARLAARTDRSSEVIEQLRSRQEKSTEKRELSLVMVQVASEANDQELLQSTLDDLEASIEQTIPANDGKKPGPTSSSPRVLTSQLQQQRERAIAAMDDVVQALWPIIDSKRWPEWKQQDDPDMKALTAKIESLANRLITFNRSTPYASVRHRDIFSKMQNRLDDPSHASSHGEAAIQPAPRKRSMLNKAIESVFEIFVP
jgi:tetratricopeptide (TPR) repeat protein